MDDDREAEHRAVLQSPSHQLAVHDRHAVVGYGDDTSAMHLADLRQLLPAQALRYRADGVDPRQPCRTCALDDVLSDRPRIVHGIGICHTGDRREAAGHRGPRAALDCLLVLVARLAQVDVHVHKAGDDPQPLGIDRVGCLARSDRAGLV
jgi:hypothetical protein